MLHFPGVLHTRPTARPSRMAPCSPNGTRGKTRTAGTSHARGSAHQDHRQEPVGHKKKKKTKPSGARVPPPRPHSDARAIGQIPSSPPVPAVREGGPKTTHVRARRRPGGWPGRPTTSQARGRSYSSWPTVSSSESPPMREPWSARNLSAMAAWTAAPVGSTSSSIMKYGECPVCTDPSVSLRTPM